MPKFSIVARTGAGETIRESRYGTTREALVGQLRRDGLVPIAVESADAGTEPGAPPRPAARRFIFGGVGLREVTVAFRTLATMLGGGLPIIDSLVDVAEQSENARFRSVLLAAATDVRQGAMLSDALAAYPAVFSPLTLALIKAGEESGNLAEILSNLSDYLEAQLDLRRRIRVSTMYPAFIMGFFCVAVSVIFFFILPRFREIFERAGAELPLLTRIVMTVSSAFAENIGYVLLVLVAGGVAFWFWRKTASGRSTIHAVLLHLPVIGRVTREMIMARLARTLGMLIDGGIPMVEALSLSAAAAGNVCVEQQMVQVRQNVVRGASLSEELSSRPHFPRLLVRMVAAGEASGRLGEMLNRAAEHFSREFSARVDMLMAMLEPALLVAIGILVGFVVIAIYFPIFSLARTVT